MSANVIEITLRGRDETRALTRGIQGLKTGIIGLVAGFSAGGVFKLFAKNIMEAEKATAQLDAAFSATGKVVGVTRKSLDDLATTMQKTTVYGDDLVKEAESILLTFNKVRGEAFGRTITVAADLSARLGTDLTQAVRTLGLALSDPEKGFDRLRRSGIVVSSELKNVVKDLVKTGQVSKAQNVILAELEARFKGSAAAARNTLGGALQGLNNAFGDLFESTAEGTSGTVKAINSLAEALTDPKIKNGLDVLVSGFSTLLTLTVKLTAATGSLVGKLYEFATSSGRIAQAFRGTLGLVNPLLGSALSMGALSASGGGNRKTRGPTGAARGRGNRPTDAASSLDSVVGVSPQEVQLIKAARIELGAYAQLLQDLNANTKSSTEQQVSAYYELKEALVLLRNEGIITQKQLGERLGEAIDESLMIDLGPIRSMYKEVRSQTTELGDFMKGVWRSAGESIRQTLSDAVYQGKLSLQSLVDIGRRVVADLISAFAVSGLKNLFTGAAGGTGFWGSLAAAFGFSAGGGSSTRPRWVGEEGRELVVPGRGGMSVYNKRQLAGMGGSGLTYAPQNSFTLIEREDPEKTKREILELVATQNSKQSAEFQRMLGRNGVEVR